MNIRKRLLCALILCPILLLAACGGNDEWGSGSSSAADTALLGYNNRFAGVVVTSGETKIERDESKSVGSISVAVGDTVTAGQVLFTYDSTQAQAEYDKAANELEQNRVKLQGKITQKTSLEAEKAAAPADSQLEYTLNIQELDTDIQELSYQISQDEKNLNELAEGMNNLDVLSPVDGKIQAINGGVGEAADQGDLSLPFIVLAKTDSYRVKAYINELNITDLQPGTPVTVRSRRDEQAWSGTVASIDYESPSQSASDSYDTESSETGNSSKYPVYVNLTSSEGLILGQHVYVESAIISDGIVDTDVDAVPIPAPAAPADNAAAGENVVSEVGEEHK